MTEQCIHLIVQYCNDERPERQAEYDDCFRRNLSNPSIAGVHNLVEAETRVPAEFRDHPKYEETRIDKWIAFSDAISYANANLSGKLVCISNLDIFLDAEQTDWGAARRLAEKGIVLCLSRHEFAPGRPPYKDPVFQRIGYANSQDAWVFVSPIQVEDCDFEIGLLGCDNAIAERLKRSGYTPVNSPNRFKIFHYDQARGKSGKTMKAVHATERDARVKNRHPERDGQYLVPDSDAFNSVDQLLDHLKVGELQRYKLICDIMTRFIKIKN